MTRPPVLGDQQGHRPLQLCNQFVHDSLRKQQVGLSEQAFARAMAIGFRQLQQTFAQSGLWRFAPGGSVEPMPAGFANGITSVIPNAAATLLGLSYCCKR